MAIFESTAFGKLSKSFGNLTTYEVRGKQVVRGKSKMRRDAQSPAQLEQRARMKAMRQLASRLAAVIREGFPGETGTEKQNCFIQQNIDLVQVDGDYRTRIDLTQLQLSSGETAAPDVTAVIDRQAGTLAFTQTAQPLRPSMPENDRVFGALVMVGKEPRCRAYPLLLRGESGTTEVTLPTDIKDERLIAYAFTMGATGKKAGATVCCAAE